MCYKCKNITRSTMWFLSNMRTNFLASCESIINRERMKGKKTYHSKYALKNPNHVFNREIQVVVHHEDAPRWCTHPWSHVQILHIGHHLCARLFIPDRAVHSVDGWPSPSLLSSRYILLLLLLYLFFLLFLHLVLLFHYLRVCAIPFPFHGRCASDTNHPLYLIHATPDFVSVLHVPSHQRGKSISDATALSLRSTEFPRLSLFQLGKLNHCTTMSCNY